jgi:Cu/Ag efflux pump CusA
VFKLVAWSVEHRAAPAFLAFLALIAGGWIARTVPLDVFPEFVPVQVEIQTEAAGLSRRNKSSKLVTRPDRGGRQWERPIWSRCARNRFRVCP